MAACSKEEAIEEASRPEMATVHLSVSPFEILTKNTDPNHAVKKHIDSVRIIDVLVFREGGALEVYKHFSINDAGGMDLSDLQINATVGKKNIYVIANAKETSWAGITTESKLLGLVVPLKKETLRNFTMSGKVSIDLQESQTVQVMLKKLIAKVVVKGVKTDFAGGPYEGMKLRSARLYLTNISLCLQKAYLVLSEMTAIQQSTTFTAMRIFCRQRLLPTSSPDWYLRPTLTGRPITILWTSTVLATDGILPSTTRV